MLTSVTSHLETMVVGAALAFKCWGVMHSVNYGYNDVIPYRYFTITRSIGALCFASLLTSAVQKVQNTRKGIGGCLFVWLIPMIHLDAFARAPTSTTPSFRGLYAQVVLDQMQVIAVLIICCQAYIFRRLWTFCFLLLLGTLWILLDPDMSPREQLPAMISCFQYIVMLFTIFDAYPQTFSFGEGLIVSQACATASFHFISSVMRIVSVFDNEQSSYDFISTISVGCSVCPAVVYSFIPTGCRKAGLYYFMSSAGLLITLISLFYFGHIQCVLTDILSDYTKVMLILWWLCVIVGSVSLVVLYNMKRWTVTTVDRKYFHLLAILIFLPGILVSTQLTKLASVVAFILFLIIEFIRYTRLPYYGEMLNNGLEIFLDKNQDSGSLILTHIYLLGGCALPLWFSSSSQSYGQHLPLFAGIISLGVGDSCASLFGSRYGRLHYPGSTKTVEGTLAAWLSMVLFSSLITWPSEVAGSQA